MIFASKSSSVLLAVLVFLFGVAMQGCGGSCTETLMDDAELAIPAEHFQEASFSLKRDVDGFSFKVVSDQPVVVLLQDKKDHETYKEDRRGTLSDGTAVFHEGSCPDPAKACGRSSNEALAEGEYVFSVFNSGDSDATISRSFEIKKC